jgi:hypothetical protein
MKDGLAKDKKESVEKLIFSLRLNLTSEDKIQLQKMINSYYRKKHIMNSKTENIAGGLLWVYSRINFLFETDADWSQKEIAHALDLEPKSISRTASAMMTSLKIDLFDTRFARKEVVDKDFRNDLFITKEGFIMHKNDVANILLKQMREKFGDIIETDEEIELVDLGEKKKEKENNKNKDLKEFF